MIAVADLALEKRGRLCKIFKLTALGMGFILQKFKFGAKGEGAFFFNISR